MRSSGIEDRRNRLPARLTAVACAGVAAALAPASPAGAAPPQPFGHECQPQNGVLFCPTDGLADRVPSFDRSPLDVDVTLPLGTQRGEPLPTIVMMHGYGGSKEDFETANPEGGDPASDTLYHWNNNYFARRGYAVVNYSARGFGDSCGTDSSASTPACQERRSYVHLADQRWEAHDTQYLLGLLADQEITRPRQIGVTGISYGGGQSIELALLRDRIRLRNGAFKRWKSPDGKPMEVAAAFPRWPWSDLVYALEPNGRFLDLRPPDEGESRHPLGVLKRSFVSGLYTLGKSRGTYCGDPPRPPGCDDETADVNRWYARVNAGEPPDAEARQIADEVFEFHQGFGLQGVRPPPILVQNGWTDDLFPAPEAIRLYRDLRDRYPGFPISMQFGDLGHQRGANKKNSDRFFNDDGSAFFDRHLRGRTEPPAPGPGDVTAFTQTCPADAPSEGPFQAGTYAALDRGVVRFSDDAGGVVTAAGGNFGTAAAFDPIAAGNDPCRQTGDEEAPGTVVARSAEDGGFTLLGLPTVRAQIDTTGDYGQLNARLWDVSPGQDAQQRLISRGTYRLRNDQDGEITFQLFGNGWCFEPGHTAKLELVGQDDPFLRASNPVPPSPFQSVAVSDLRVALPTAESNPGSGCRVP
jgi:hypothetical protein